MDKCPGLIGGLNDPSTSCNIPAAVPDDFTISDTTVLTALPGNNPVTGWGSAPGSGYSSSGSSSGSGSGSYSGSGSGSGTPTTTVAAPPAGSSAASGSGSGMGSGPESSSAAEADPTPTSTPTSTPDGSGALTVNTTSDSISSSTGWSDYGCWSDKLSGTRVLSGITFANLGVHQVTTTKCIAYCSARGWSLAGTEYGGQCFCGNALVDSTELSESKCNMPCEGDETQICGGSLALSVYKKPGSGRRRRHLSAHTHKHVAKPLKV
jgi:hypothetical protein